MFERFTETVVYLRSALHTRLVSFWRLLSSLGSSVLAILTRTRNRVLNAGAAIKKNEEEFWAAFAAEQVGYAAGIKEAEQRIRKEESSSPAITPTLLISNLFGAIGIVSLAEQENLLELKSVGRELIALYQLLLTRVAEQINLALPDFLHIGRFEWELYVLGFLIFTALARARYRYVVRRGELRKHALSRVFLNVRLRMTTLTFCLFLPERFSVPIILVLSGLELLRHIVPIGRFPWAPRPRDVLFELSVIAAWIAAIWVVSMFITI